MKLKLWPVVALAVMLTVGAGCNVPVTSFVGESIMAQQVIRGEVEVAGENIEVRLETGSYVPKLSILGWNNTVVFDNGAAVARVDIAGEGNVVRTSQGAPVVITDFGDSNKVIIE
jgi:hypothetical protein